MIRKGAWTIRTKCFLTGSRNKTGELEGRMLNVQQAGYKLNGVFPSNSRQLVETQVGVYTHTVYWA